MDMIEMVKRALRVCVDEEKTCDECAYKQKVSCTDSRNRDALEVIELLEEQNEELRDANERLSEKLKDAWKLWQGVLPMPCNVGDPLWAVFEEDGMISVTKTACKDLLWNGESWLISDDDCCWEVPDEAVLFLSIEAAVKKAEEMLRNGNDA
jgi:hypothetical protein